MGCVDLNMASVIKTFEPGGRGDAGHGKTGNQSTLLLYFLVVPVCISALETLLQFPVTSQGNLAVSFGFALAFTIPGTLFAWGTTMALARLPVVQALPVVALLVIGYGLSILIFSPYNRFVYEAASEMLPHMRDMASLRHDSSGWPQMTAFLLANLPAVLIWTAMNLVFMARTGFPHLRVQPVVARPGAEPSSPEPSGAELPGAELPAFCRGLNIGDLSELWSVSAEEHYLRLVGSFGVRMIRHPFGAAIEQLPANCGVQVHRSHWVAFGRVARIDSGRDVQLVLVDGTVIPVSKSYRRAVGLVEAALLAA